MYKFVVIQNVWSERRLKDHHAHMRNDINLERESEKCPLQKLGVPRRCQQAVVQASLQLHPNQRGQRRSAADLDHAEQGSEYLRIQLYQRPPPMAG
jgi:hypothetical protein